MSFPITYTLKMDFSGTTFGGSPTWTDVSTYVLPYSNAGQVQDGRQDESSDVNPGQFTFTLDNRDDRFTPGKSTLADGVTANPYYPHVKPGVRVRLEVTVATTPSATVVEYYDGYVDSFETYLATDRAFGKCDVIATDVLGRLGRTVPLRSILIEEILKTSPTTYVPMTDTVLLWGTAQIAQALATTAGWSYGTDHTTSTLGSFQFGATGPPGDTSGGLTIADYSASDGIIYEITPPLGVNLGATVFAAQVWFHNAVQVTGRPLVLLTSANEAVGIDVSLSGTSYVIKAFVGSTLSAGTSTGVITKDKWDQLGIEVTATGTGPYTVTCNVICDGTQIQTVSASLTSHQIANVMIGGQLVSGASTTLIPGDYSHFAVWTTGAPSWSTLYSAGSTAFAGEATTTHATRILSYRASAISLVTSGSYSGTVGLHDLTGASVQSALFDTAHVEAAPIYADGQGGIVLLNRGQMTSPTTAATLDASDGDLMATLKVRADNQYLVNEYEITPSSGNVAKAQDLTSQGAYGYYSGSQSAPFYSDSDALTVAQDIVTALKDPLVGTSQLDVDLFALAQHNLPLVASLLAVRTGGVVALTNLPAPFGALTVMVQGRSLAFTTTSAVLTLFTTGTGAGVANTPTGAAA